MFRVHIWSICSRHLHMLTYIVASVERRLLSAGARYLSTGNLVREHWLHFSASFCCRATFISSLLPFTVNDSLIFVRLHKVNAVVLCADEINLGNLLRRELFRV